MIRCPQCGAEAVPLLRARDYNRRLSNETFEYYRCASCGLIFLPAVPENLSDYYPPSYYQFPATAEAYLPLIQFQQYKLDLVKQFVTSGSVLEIGPGPGDFALLAKRAGFSVDVIEMDERSCQFLRDVIQVNVVNSDDILNALQGMGQYHVIALWQVIEHLPDAWDVVDALAQHVIPGGIVVIAAPNPDALQFRLFGRFWTHLDAPRHVQLIPAHLLSERMEKNGFRTVLATVSDRGTIGWNAFGWTMTLGNFVYRSRGLRRGMWVFGKVLQKLVSPVERSGWRGSTYTLILKR